jgi:hypothetical protein
VVDRPALGISAPPSERSIYPDVHVVAEPPPVYAAAGVAAVAVELTSPMLDQAPQISVEIRDVAERRLVTIIEILSPVNKRGRGAQEYLDRRIELMQTATHLLEIDLLSAGYRIPLEGELPPALYYIYLSHYDRRPRTAMWALRLQEPLPRVPVPLLPPDADVVLDLQAAVDACFALVGYERLLNYRVAPPGALSVADQTWVAVHLATQGLAA